MIPVVDTNPLGYIGIVLTIVAVGVSRAGLVLKLHNDSDRRMDSTNKRIDVTNTRIDGTNKQIGEFNARFVEMEKGQVRPEGCLAGMQGRTSPSDQKHEPRNK